MDNAKALVEKHDAATREVEFNDRFLAFAAHWGFRPRACARRTAAVRAAAGSDPQGAGGLRGDGGHERLFGAVASDRRAGARGGLRRSGARPPRRSWRITPSTPAGARIVERAHLAGVNAGPRREAAPSEGGADAKEPALLRPLDEYAAVAGGRF